MATQSPELGVEISGNPRRSISLAKSIIRWRWPITDDTPVVKPGICLISISWRSYLLNAAAQL
ncbi:hypothetical protein [Sphingobium mellinum]|uniref:hypothetical protein n=1 Tax=Sphingobium mellinum TaxID=1387166 RepID=UPI0030EEC6A5